MRYHMIEVRYNHDMTINLYDMSALMYQSRLRVNEWRGKPLEEIKGTDHTVYVLDPDESFNRAEKIALATKFLMGDYEVYSLATDRVSRGKRLLER